MNHNFDLSLIEQFRDVANHSFIQGKYINYNGKNFWNIMCSAMDWIDVSANGIPEMQFKSDILSSYTTSLNVMQYIVAIDLMVESIIQLYRVLWGKDEYPLKKDKSVFNKINLTDDTYFKHLRAAFGTHPVNLKSHDGVTKSSDGEKWYASWTSADLFEEEIFEVTLYSNQYKIEDDYVLKINLEKVHLYATKRYNLLTDLKELLENEIKNHRIKYLKEKIPVKDDSLLQLEILITEDNRRFPLGTGYASELSNIKSFLESDISKFSDIKLEETVNNYKSSLIERLQFIKENLENMTYSIEGYTHLFMPARHFKEPLKAFSDYRYSMRKIYEYFHIAKRRDAIAISDINYLVSQLILPVEILETSSKVEKELIFNAYFYNLNHL